MEPYWLLGFYYSFYDPLTSEIRPLNFFCQFLSDFRIPLCNPDDVFQHISNATEFKTKVDNFSAKVEGWSTTFSVRQNENAGWLWEAKLTGKNGWLFLLLGIYNCTTPVVVAQQESTHLQSKTLEVVGSNPAGCRAFLSFLLYPILPYQAFFQVPQRGATLLI